uniref:Retrovirus-related Pol polyprotein from transposon TNT 1-94 n=1 Tax=Tanacetum cinerariifolium TaxID=118510 RepID=A0A6L2L7R5_TANCI|nr:retrovirus-related Pol polyprotein from transposon TNT 1-94 [Tanacetum cinerariifolium]
MSMDDLYNNLKVYEPEVNGMSSSNSSTKNMAFMSSSKNSSTNRAVNTAQAVNTANGVSTANTQINDAFTSNIDNLSNVVICAYLGSQPNSPQLAHVNLGQIHPDDLEEMDLKWQMAMLTIRAIRFLKKSGRNLTINGNESIGFDKSNVECYNYHKRGHFARECRALRNQDTKHKESTRRSVLVETHASTALVSCDGIGGYDWSDQAEEGPNYALMAFTSSSSNTKIVDNCKKGLGYESYNAVPPSYTENFMPLKHDLSYTGSYEFVDKPVADNTKSSQEETKALRNNSDALIIEKWVSDDEDENVTQPKIVKKTVKPNIVKKEFVKPRQQKKARKTGNPQMDLQDKGVIDSGCLKHMTGNISYLIDYEEIDGGYVAFGGNLNRGKITGKSLMKKMYCLVVTDDYSRFTWVFFLATKDKTSGILKSFTTRIENLVDHKVKVIRCDNRIELKNREMNQFCEMKGIMRQFRVAITPQQNRVVKRRNRILIKAARTMLANSKLPTTFWAVAVNTACYVQNRVFPVTILNTKDHLGKFNGKADEGLFVGYFLNSKAFRVFNSRTRIVEENLHIRFSENTPNIDDGFKPLSDEGKKVDEDPSKGIKCNDQEKEMNVNNTNNVNTVSSTVYAAGTNEDNKLLFNLNMPALEDVGLFDFLNEDEDEVADMNNLDTTIQSLLKDEDGEEVDVHMYRSMIGLLTYLTSSRPGFMFAVCACARYQVNPKVSHLYVVKRIFTYLKGHPKLGLWYSKDSLFDLVAYTDSDYAGASLGRKSTTGGITYYCWVQVTAVAEKPTESEGFKKIVDFLSAHTLRVDGKEIIITELSVRRDLQLADEDGVDCLPNSTIFENLELMGIPKRKNTHVTQPSGSTEHVADEAVYKESDDRLVRAATTASSLKADQDSGNIDKKVTPNEASPLGTNLGGGPKCQEAMRDTLLKLARLDSSEDEQNLGKDASKQGRIKAIDADEDITLVNDQDDAKMLDINDLQGEEVVADKEVNATSEIIAASIATTNSVVVTITTEEITLAQELVEIKTTKPKAKRIVLEEPNLQERERESAQKELEANIDFIETWDDVQAKIDADYQMAKRLQAEEQQELTDEEKATLFMQLLEKRRKFFTTKRAKEKKNKPPIQAQQRKIMCTYLKNMEGKKLKDLKNKSFNSIQKIFDRAFKRQKVDDDKETSELTQLMEIIPNKEDVAIDAIPWLLSLHGLLTG